MQRARIDVEAAKAGVASPFGLTPGESQPKQATEAPVGTGAELANQPPDIVEATLAGLPEETKKRVLEEKRVAELPWLEKPPVYPFTSPFARTRGEVLQDAGNTLGWPWAQMLRPGKKAEKKGAGPFGINIRANPFGFMFGG